MLAEIELNTNVLLSGGAQGADSEFGKIAAKAKHQVVHWTFDGHKSKLKSNLYTLPKEQLEKADPYLVRANKSLVRTFPTKSEHTNNLLRRNYYQVESADSVYAVASFVDDTSLLKIGGGTAWACQLYVDRFLYDQEPWHNCKLFMFDQNSEKWLQWTKTWQLIDQPPAPTGIYAGIGSRDLSDASIAAIRALYQG